MSTGLRYEIHIEPDGWGRWESRVAVDYSDRPGAWHALPAADTWQEALTLAGRKIRELRRKLP